MQLKVFAAAAVTLAAVFSVPAQAQSVVGIAFSQDETTISIGRQDKDARIYDLATGARTHTVRDSLGAYAMAFSEDGKTLFHPQSYSGALRAYDIATRNITSFTGEAGGGIWEMHLSPNGKFLATANVDGSIKVWNVGPKRLRFSVKPDHGQSAATVAIASNKELYAAGRLGSVVVLLAKDGTKLRSGAKIGGIYEIALLPRKNRLLATTNYLQEYDAKSMQVKRVGSTETYHVTVGGEFVGTCANDDPSLLRVTDLEVVRTFKSKYGCRTVELSASGKMFAVGDAVGITRIYDTSTFKQVRILR